ncbi:MAG: VWA domain-containing protein, partial [Ruminiclostridium sp.]|nr:VWA domain-containing protein [Ruminiclostridium sp.]
YPKSVQPTSNENDVNFKRLTFAEKFVNALDKNVKFSISVFSSDFSTICSFSDDKKRVVDAINSIRTIGAGIDGTSVENALMEGLGGFTDDMIGERNIIILLTDGISTDSKGYTDKDIVSLAKKKNAMIITIGLGNEIDTHLLDKIADLTGGNYYPISEANILEGLYSTLVTSMRDDIIDTDLDGKPDSYTIYETDFDPAVNGFSFGSFMQKNGELVDYGMCSLARAWFTERIGQSTPEGTNRDIAYTFEGTTIDIEEPLRKVSLKIMEEPWFDPGEYLDFLSIGQTLSIKPEDELNAGNKGWIKHTIPYTDESTEWTEAQILVPDHTQSAIRNGYSANDFQMLHAILYYDSFRDNEKIEPLNIQSDFTRLRSALSTGTPAIAKIIWDNKKGGYYNRYVLITALRRSLDDPDQYRISIYDVAENSSDTITLTRTPRAVNSSADDFIYSAVWHNNKISLLI